MSLSSGSNSSPSSRSQLIRPNRKSFNLDIFPHIMSKRSSKVPSNILFVGSIYQDTILGVNGFPREDSKQRAESVNVRRGGNVGNSLEVLAQFPKVNLWLMSAMANKDIATPLISDLESMGVKMDMIMYRKHRLYNPSSYIIQDRIGGTRTIINHNEIEDLTALEFMRKINFRTISKTASFESATTAPFKWVHFEGRNVRETCQMIDQLDAKAIKEGWRSKVTISVECEKPDREGIDELIRKGDVVFFSSEFAKGRGFDKPVEFLKSISHRCKSHALLYCTHGARGAYLYNLRAKKIDEAPALPLAVVADPTGAGDTFIAGVIYGITRGHSPKEAQLFACQLASRKVAQQGFAGLVERMQNVFEATQSAARIERQDAEQSRNTNIEDVQNKLTGLGLRGNSENIDIDPNSAHRVLGWRNSAVIGGSLEGRDLELFVNGDAVELPDWAWGLSGVWSFEDGSGMEGESE